MRAALVREPLLVDGPLLVGSQAAIAGTLEERPDYRNHRRRKTLLKGLGPALFYRIRTRRRDAVIEELIVDAYGEFARSGGFLTRLEDQLGCRCTRDMF